jgi:hypothetical protein
VANERASAGARVVGARMHAGARDDRAGEK